MKPEDQRLNVAVEATMARRCGLASTKESPSRISWVILEPGTGSGGGSRRRMRTTNRAEAPMVRASTRSAIGAPSHPMSWPASAGPLM